MLRLLQALLLFVQLPSAAPDVDPALRSVVDRFFETQQSEDVEGYLALWSARASRPQPAQLKYIFDSGDDKFIDLVITRATINGESARVRVAVTRVRTDPRLKNPDGSPRILSTPVQFALAFVRENGDWKIVREGSPSDELAAALIETDDPAARKALLEAEPDLLGIRLVESIARRADALAQITKYREAQAIYERGLEVARAIGDRRAEGQAIQNIGNALYYQRAFPAALKRYEERLAIEREIGNDEGIANALLGIGTIQYSTYDYSAALQAYRGALVIQEKLNDEVLIGTTLISTGNVLYLQGDFEGAIADYRRAETLKRRNHDLTGAVTALEGLGRVYYAQGDFAAALGAFNQVLDEWRKRNVAVRRASVLQNIGETHFRLGNNDQARAAFEESRRDFETVKDVANAGRVLQGMALNELVVGRFPGAEKAYTDSITLCTSAKDPECIARAQVGLAFALAAQERFDDAITWYGRSLISFNDLNMDDPLARARIGLAEAYAGKKEYEKALEQATSARRTGVALASDDLLWRALVAQARAERKLGKPVEALGSAKAALLAVERMAAAALDRPDHAVPHDTTAAYVAVALLQAESGDAADAFSTVERMRAHALRIALAPNERDISRGMTDGEREEERTLAMELTSLIVKRDRQKDLPKPDTAIIEKLDASIKEVTVRRTAARERLFARLPELQIWRGLATPATLDDLRLLLNGPDHALLEVVVDDHDVIFISAANAGAGAAPLTVEAHVVPIGRQTLAERIVRALDGKALANVETWRTASADLFHLLPSPVVERLTASRNVTIVADDLMWRVPFEAMPVGTQYLADRAVVTYAASVGAVVRPPASAIADLKGPMIAVGAPELPSAFVETLKTTAPTWSIRAPDAAQIEVQKIRGTDDGRPDVTVLAGRDATREQLIAAAAAGSLKPLHVAAPFRINSGGPLFSPILLASREPDSPPVTPDARPLTSDPRPLTPVLETRELFRLEPLAAVVMFSDPAALSKRDAASAAGIVSWAWRSSGATGVIFRRWGGDDATAAEVIGRFYDELRAGKSAPDALDAARAAVRSTEAGRAPAAWGGWMMFAGR